MQDEGAWHGLPCQWRKVHPRIDVATLEILAIVVTDNATGDAPMLPCLLDQIADSETIASVSGDGAYDTKGCHEAIAQRGAQAIIPTRKNAKPWKYKRPGLNAPQCHPGCHAMSPPKIWKRLTGYHRRSLVETKMRCFKLLGERVMTRDFDR